MRLERQTSAPRDQAKKLVLAQRLIILQKTHPPFIRDSRNYLQQLQLAELEGYSPPPQKNDVSVHLLPHCSYLHQLFHQVHYSATVFFDKATDN